MAHHYPLLVFEPLRRPLGDLSHSLLPKLPLPLGHAVAEAQRCRERRRVAQQCRVAASPSSDPGTATAGRHRDRSFCTVAVRDGEPEFSAQLWTTGPL
jgi:hypothetical protein